MSTACYFMRAKPQNPLTRNGHVSGHRLSFRYAVFSVEQSVARQSAETDLTAMYRDLKMCVRSSALTVTILPLLFMTSLAAEDTQHTVSQLPAEPTWYRQTVQISGTATSPTELRVAVTGITTVYLNGQRLVRNQPLSDITSWTVPTLLRNGTNCVAMSVAAGQQPRPVSVWFASTKGLTIQPAAPKVATATPPVGWQQTDFNDRDWSAVTGIPADQQQPVTDVVHERSWQPVSREAHVVDGQFHFVDNDHTVLLGGTFVERSQTYGHLEASLTAAAGCRGLTFRNLGWSADTVFAESRGIFDTPQKGYERMIEHVRAEEPTVIILHYGQNEALSFAGGNEGLERFRQQLGVLSRDLATTGAQLVFVSPHAFVKVPEPLPDTTRWNVRLAEFRDAVRTVAKAEGIPFVDLFHQFVDDMETASAWFDADGPVPEELSAHPDLRAVRHQQWTDNGMHWNEAGYRCAAQVFTSRLLNRPLRRPAVRIDTVQQTLVPVSGSVRATDWSGESQAIVRFDYRPELITAVPLQVHVSAGMMSEPAVGVQYPGAMSPVPLRQRLTSNGEPIVFMAEQCPDYERLRALIVRKNELYFHRWRPQNITYLFGFRKHEQGNNASEIATFDPLIADLEQQIEAAQARTWRAVTVTESR
ncbi:MAG: SGNH/GDSL hydrolase family protein [Planctomycetaceae bacterium]